MLITANITTSVNITSSVCSQILSQDCEVHVMSFNDCKFEIIYESFYLSSSV